MTCSNPGGQRPVHGRDVQDGGVKRVIGTVYLCHPLGVLRVVWMSRDGQGIQDLFVSGKSSAVLQRAATGTVEHPGRRSACPRGVL